MGHHPSPGAYDTAHANPWQERVTFERIRALDILDRRFFVRDTVTVARELLGKTLEFNRRAGRIVEVEAYLPVYQGEIDRAAHSSRGLTERTRVIFGKPGHAYVYLIYGMYECLNIVAEPEGVPGCVLIRALEPLSGIEAMRRARPAARTVTQLCSGPGRLTQAFGITRALYGADVTQGKLLIRKDAIDLNEQIEASPRIGIRESADWPLRFHLAGNPHVSRR